MKKRTPGQGVSCALSWLDFPSNITNLHALPQRSQRVRPFRHEFLRHEALESGFQNRLHHRRIVEFLRLVDLSPPRHPASMVVPDVLMVLPDRVADVAFHNL